MPSVADRDASLASSFGAPHRGVPCSISEDEGGDGREVTAAFAFQWPSQSEEQSIRSRAEGRAAIDMCTGSPRLAADTIISHSLIAYRITRQVQATPRTATPSQHATSHHTTSSTEREKFKVQSIQRQTATTGDLLTPTSRFLPPLAHPSDHSECMTSRGT